MGKQTVYSCDRCDSINLWTFKAIVRFVIHTEDHRDAQHKFLCLKCYGMFLDWLGEPA